jgi:hypothetical protein
MHRIFRGLILPLWVTLTLCGCSRTYVAKIDGATAAASESSKRQVLRYRITEVSDPERPGIEWQLDPPLSRNHDALQILFWARGSHMKICKGRDGRYIRATTPFQAPRPLEGTVFELNVEHVDGDTLIKLSFLQEGVFRTAATMRVPGIRNLDGPSDEYLCSIDPI